MASDITSTGMPGAGLRAAAGADLRQLERDLAAAVDGEVRFDAGTRAAYSTDASNFRQVPIGVVRIYRKLREMRETHQDHITAKYPDIPRRRCRT